MREPLFAFLVGVLVAFVGIRVSVRLIRAQVGWCAGNIVLGGLHIHHLVFGVGLMVASAIGLLAAPAASDGWRSLIALVFGVGTGLVLDEFALLLHLEDVYWTARGRTSVDAVFAVVVLSGMVLLGLRPFGLYHRAVQDHPTATVLILLASVALTIVTLLKGKVWTGLVGIFMLPLLIPGAVRLSRPQAPWALARYGRRPDRQQRAQQRERRLRGPVTIAKIRLQEFLAGRHDLPEPIPTPGASAIGEIYEQNAVYPGHDDSRLIRPVDAEVT